MKTVGTLLIAVALIAGMVGCAGESYALVITSTEGGNVTSPGEGIFVYDEGTVVNLTAKAEACYRFLNWTGNVSTIVNCTVASTNITMNGDYFITANFVRVYNLTIFSTAGGNVTMPGEGTFTYDSGTVVNLNAAADFGYKFVSWTGDVGTISNSTAALTSITMDGSYYITANFTKSLFIEDWYDLNNIRGDLGGYYILMNDLNSTTPGYAELASPTANGGHGWEPIGNWDNRFAGVFDGNGYTISDLYIYHLAYDAGLFSTLDEGGVVEDIGLLNVDVNGYRCVGGLVGENGGTISNCYANGSVTATDFDAGLLVGINQDFGTISHCYATGVVTAQSWAGGLVGSNFGNMSNCHAISNVTADWEIGGLMASNQGATVTNCYAITLAGHAGSDHVGGLMGENYDGVVNRCYAMGTVTGNHWVGGLVGESSSESATIDDCCAIVTVTGSESVGGLVGGNIGPVSSSYSIGNVTGNSSIGGLVGYNQGVISNSYAMGDVGGSSYVGGLVGKIWGSVHESYSAGVVSGETYVGGLCGGGSISGSNSFWDTETSGQNYSHGGTGKSTMEMKDFSLFLAATWDVVAVANPSIHNLAYIWNIVDDVTYPFLSWQP